MDVEMQCRAHWCWAAVSVSIGRHYNVVRDQAEFAQSVLAHYGRTYSDAECLGQPCDAGSRLCSAPLPELPLNLLPLATNPPTPGPPAEALLLDQMKNRRPVGALIYWRSAKNIEGGHFIAIVGATSVNGVTRFQPGDPMHPGIQSMTYAELVNYKTDGDWVATWLT